MSERPWWLLAPAVALLIIFYFWERRWGGRGRETLIDLALLKVRSYMFGLGAGHLLLRRLHLDLPGDHPVPAGRTALQRAGGRARPRRRSPSVRRSPATLGSRLVQRFGRSLVVIGLVLVATGWWSSTCWCPHLNGMVGLKLAPALLLAGFGGGLVITPNVTLTLAEVDPRRAGSGGGMLQTAQRVGSAIGVALVLAQFFAALASSRRRLRRGAVGQPADDDRSHPGGAGLRHRRPDPALRRSTDGTPRRAATGATAPQTRPGRTRAAGPP